MLKLNQKSKNKVAQVAPRNISYLPGKFRQNQSGRIGVYPEQTYRKNLKNCVSIIVPCITVYILKHLERKTVLFIDYKQVIYALIVFI